MVIFLSGCMAVSLIVFLQRVYKGGYVSQLLLKIITSIFFIGIAVAAFFKADGDKNYFSLMLLGFVFSLVGDIFMQINKAGDTYHASMFAGGIGSFFCAHCFFASAFAHVAGFSVLDIFVFIAAITVLGELFLLLKLELGSFRILSLFYLSIILFMATKAISVTYIGGGFTLFSALLMAAAVLFVSSDTMLTLQTFHTPSKKSKILPAAVLITYYLAQALFAYSILYA